MEPRIAEVARRIRTLREDLDLSIEKMAEATGLTPEEYTNAESGETDVPFSFLYRCAEEFGVDIIELLTGETPHLTHYEVARAGEGLTIQRRAGFGYLHLAPFFRDKLAEPLFVTAPYIAEEQDAPIHLSQHEGQEFDYVLSGRLRFAYGDHEEELAAGDSLFYDSGRGHGMIATGGEPCTFLAVVIRNPDADAR